MKKNEEIMHGLSRTRADGCRRGVLKVTVHLQTDHFVEILIFRLMYRSKHELTFHLKKILQNIKYRRGNGGFKFWPEVKITRLIDIFSAVFSNQVFHLKRTLQKAKTHGEFVRLPPKFDSG